jgi:hypothetical protein
MTTRYHSATPNRPQVLRRLRGEANRVPRHAPATPSTCGHRSSQEVTFTAQPDLPRGNAAGPANRARDVMRRADLPRSLESEPQTCAHAATRARQCWVRPRTLDDCSFVRRCCSCRISASRFNCGRNRRQRPRRGKRRAL